MAVISKLPDTVANKISAGEVVQRPASVVKELLENAVDSGATRITVVVRDVGKQLIQIIDNGCGMSGEDALLSVERFATSKITRVEDLDSLVTLGFRGEALASISSVAHFELKTRRPEEQLGTLLKMEGGVLEGTFPVQTEPGTTISVRNLFFNVPARRKFLKTNATEFRHVHEVVKSLVLAYPEIEWRMLNDDEELFHFRSQDVRERLSLFYGEGFGESLIEITEENDFLSIGGYLGKPGMMARQKYDQYFYINRRIIQNRMLAQALQQAYGELLHDRQSAFALLFLGIDPGKVDVNVHPSKLEVRFDDERSVRNMVYPVIRRAIRMHDFSPEVGSVVQDERILPGMAVPPEREGERKLGYTSFSGKVSTTRELYRNYLAGSVHHAGPAGVQGSAGAGSAGVGTQGSAGAARAQGSAGAGTSRAEGFAGALGAEGVHGPSGNAGASVPSWGGQGSAGSQGVPGSAGEQENIFSVLYRGGGESPSEKPPVHEPAVAASLSGPGSLHEVTEAVLRDMEPKIWQLHHKYIVCQIKTGLMVIDQHVAHERVLYERAVDVMNEQVPNSQQLLFPQRIDLKPWQYEVYREIGDDIDRLGFTVRSFGSLTVMIEGVPQDVQHGTEATILQDMIAEYQENATKLKLEKRDNLARSYACRNAIMTGQKLSHDEMKTLIDKLFATRMPYVCPHGRPVIIRLSLDELDRMFGRK